MTTFKSEKKVGVKISTFSKKVILIIFVLGIPASTNQMWSLTSLGNYKLYFLFRNPFVNLLCNISLSSMWSFFPKAPISQSRIKVLEPGIRTGIRTGIRDTGSGIRDPGSGTRDPDRDPESGARDRGYRSWPGTRDLKNDQMRDYYKLPFFPSVPLKCLPCPCVRLLKKPLINFWWSKCHH
jgi:hypothetical protein